MTLPDGTRKVDTWLRWFRTTSYFLMFSAGVLLFFAPEVLADLGAVGWVMTGFLTLGGGLSLYGAITEKWVGEFLGIPLLASSFTVFGAISTIPTFMEAPYISGANFALLVAVALSLLARWREVKATYRLVLHVARKHG